MNWLSALTEHAQRLYGSLMPMPCLLCGTLVEQQCLCQSCQHSLPYLTESCPRCALPVSDNKLCGQCLHSPPQQEFSISLFHYQHPIDRLIADLKYRDKLALNQFFSPLLAQRVIESDRPLPKQLIPIPLHSKRIQQRGYNQAAELAKQLSRQLSIATNFTSLIKVKDTPPQASLQFDERKRNIKNAFQVDNNNLADHVALIDDVMTTGSTVDAAARCLRKNGVRYIEVWTIARTSKKSRSP